MSLTPAAIVPTIQRHRTALTRTGFSKPIRQALADHVMPLGATVFDYGCGRGADVRGLQAAGYAATGWDPAHAPDTPLAAARIVNLGYVVNVIESDTERQEALRRAWSIAESLLIVTARLKFDALGQALTTFADGCLTTRGTFQKFYDHTELRDWISATLAVEPVAAAPGMFYVFRHADERESFVASRHRRTPASWLPQATERLYEQHRALFDAVTPFFCERGRLPSVNECSLAADLYATVPRLDAILKTVEKVIGGDAYRRIVGDRRQDLLVYLALSRFTKRPPVHRLPEDLQLDIRSFFRSYQAACTEADQLLLTVGSHERRDAAFRETTLGKLTGNALYIHTSALSRLPTLLRLYEGCARSYVGAVDGTTIVKFHRWKSQISYLSYPRFDADAHPVLAGSLVVDLQRLAVHYRDYLSHADPPLLHRKELFVAADYPRRERFEALTKAEEKHGLLSGVVPIGSKAAWEGTLRAAGFVIRGHRLTHLGDASPRTQSSRARLDGE